MSLPYRRDSIYVSSWFLSSILAPLSNLNHLLFWLAYNIPRYLSPLKLLFLSIALIKFFGNMKMLDQLNLMAVKNWSHPAKERFLVVQDSILVFILSRRSKHSFALGLQEIRETLSYLTSSKPFWIAWDQIFASSAIRNSSTENWLRVGSHTRHISWTPPDTMKNILKTRCLCL